MRHPFERLVSGYQALIHDGSTIYKGFVKLNKDHMDQNSDKRPTFPQYVDYILNKTNLDWVNDPVIENAHVIPMWRNCGACQYKFDIIGKVETFTKDYAYILRVSS